MNQIKSTTVVKGHYASTIAINNFVSFENETGFNEFDSNKDSNRLLFLSSFWNAMAYWNVNIYLADHPWSQVLKEMISEFKKADNFGFAKNKLFSRLNDSHANYSYSDYLNSLNKFPDIGGRIINDSLVITNIYNKKRQESNNIFLLL